MKTGPEENESNNEIVKKGIDRNGREQIEKEERRNKRRGREMNYTLDIDHEAVVLDQ